MSFLTPLFLVGAAAVALPIIFHLIRRTTRERMTFSSLMFLKPSPPRVTRRSRVENILLLLLRCLVLCLLALGFSRPFLQKPMAPNAAAGTGKRLVVLLDASASMQRDGLWNEARDRARGWLRQAEPEDAVAIYAFERQARAVISFEQWSTAPIGDRTAVASQAIDALKPGWAGTHLGQAILTGVEALEDSRNEKSGDLSGARQIIVISDFQEGSRLEGLQGFDWPRGIEVVLEPVRARRPTNAGLQLISDADETVRPAADAPPRLRVSNSGDARREQFQIGWAATGESRPAGPIIDAYVPPGQSRTMSASAPPTNAPAEHLVLTGDDEPFDNTVHLVPPRPEQVRVLFLGNDAAGDSTQLLYYLRRAFQETRRETVQIIPRPAETPLTTADLDGCHLVIATDGLAEARVAPLREFLSRGKTVLFVLKSPAGAPALARLAGLDSLPAEEAVVRNYALFGQIDFQHPLFAPFADPRFSDFTKIHFWKHRRLDTNRLAAARVLARFDSGDPALLQWTVGQGTLLALTSGWQPADSQLALSSKFVPLLYSILDQAGGLKAQLAQYAVGDDIALPTASGSAAAANTFAVRKPDGTRVEIPAGQTRFSGTELPGIYTLTSQQSTQRFAVNLDAAESRTAPMAADQLERLGVPLKRGPLLAAQQREEEKRRQLHANELEGRQKLWRWLLVTALVVLVLETWLAGRLARPGATAPAAS